VKTNRPHSAESTILGTSRAAEVLKARVEQLARTEMTVLIQGPTGSGKDVVARAIHEESARVDGPFVVLDCGAMSRDLAESILFGHAAGAFPGAAESREGFLEAAHRGTLLLDDVGALPIDVQPRLLRALETRTVTRVGETTPRPLDIRLLCATSRDLRRVVESGQLRADLYVRFTQSRVTVPSLAERRDDISMLADEFLERTAWANGRVRALSDEARALLVAREYAGNVRELRHVLDRAACLCDGPIIERSDLIFDEVLRVTDAWGQDGSTTTTEEATMDATTLNLFPDFKEAKQNVVDDFEKQYLERLMARTDGNIAMGAGIAGLERHYLRSLLRKHGLYAAA
jgi:DNA-binding NtrC family response regulator